MSPQVSKLLSKHKTCESMATLWLHWQVKIVSPRWLQCTDQQKCKLGVEAYVTAKGEDYAFMWANSKFAVFGNAQTLKFELFMTDISNWQ